MEEETERLVEILPDVIREGGALPFAYYLVRNDASPAPVYRLARSTLYRAQATHCLPFYKPISRCLKVEE